MRNLSSLLFALLIQVSYAQVPYWQWSHTFGGYHYDVGSSIANDHNGNLVACGYYYGDTIFVGNQTLLNKGGNDLYLAKYDATGNLLWANRAGGTGDDYASSVSADVNGNIYLAGMFSSDTLLIGNDTLINSSTIGGYSDMFIAKYNSSGNPVWAKKFGSTSWDLAQAIAVDVMSGNIYVAGCFYDSSITVGTFTLPNNGWYDILLMKMDPSGNVLWARNSGGTLNDMGNAVCVDNAGNAIISGGFASNAISFTSGTLTNAFTGQPDIFAAKFDANGNNLWARRAGDIDNDHSVAVDADDQNNIFVSGHFHSTSFPFAASNITNAGMGDVYLLKYDANGNELWGRSAGGMMHDFGYAVTSDAAGNSYISGMFNSDTMMVGMDMLINHAASQDMFLIKYDASGNEQWSLSAGGNGDDEMNSIAMGDFQNVYVTGDWRSNTMSLGSQNYVNTDSSVGYADIFIGNIDNWLGMGEAVNSSDDISVYPNPSTGKFRIQDSRFDIGTLFIYNSTGQLIREISGFRSDEIVDLSNEAPGIYFIRFSLSETTYKVSILR